MPNNNIKFIGTGSGETQKERFHSSFAFCINDEYCLIDAGDGISKALLLADIPFEQIKSVIISHMHPDHYTGLASLITQMKLIKRKEPLTVYMHESIKDTIEQFIINSYLFPDRLDFTLEFESFISDEFFKPFHDIEVITRQNSHLDKFINDTPGRISFTCSSFLFRFAGKTIFYTGDIGSEEDLYLFNDYNINLMISEVTHIEIEKIHQAFTSQQADRLYLTHISTGDIQKINSFLSGSKSEKIIIAEDGQTIRI